MHIDLYCLRTPFQPISLSPPVRATGAEHWRGLISFRTLNLTANNGSTGERAPCTSWESPLTTFSNRLRTHVRTMDFFPACKAIRRSISTIDLLNLALIGSPIL